MRLLVAMTYRNIELDHSSAFARPLEEVKRTGSISQIRLRGLDEGEVAVMLRGLSLRDPLGLLVKVIFDETPEQSVFCRGTLKISARRGQRLRRFGAVSLSPKGSKASSWAIRTARFGGREW